MNIIIALLSAVAFTVVAVMTVTGPLLPLIATEFGRSVGQAGLIVTAFAVPYGAFQIVFGPIGDRYGKLRVIAIALATDSNPGSSPMTSLLLAMNMGCTLFRLTPEEALAGATINAAKALGLDGETGSIETGKRADLCVWRAAHPCELSYTIGYNPLKKRIFDGII